MNARAVYLSYRRSFSHYVALGLFHELRRLGFDVYMNAGEYDLRDAVDLAQIDARSHFLIVLTPSLLETLQASDDPLWREIERALHGRRNIVPLLTNGFTFTNSFVPPDLSSLRRYHTLTVQPDDLAAVAVTLDRRYLNTQIFGTLVPPPAADHDTMRRRIEETARQPQPTPDELRAEVIFNRAHARSRQDHAGRLADLNEVLRLNPDHVYARFDRALERRRTGDEAGAVEDYNEVLRRSPYSYKAYNNRAELHFAHGHYERALADYERATALRSDYTMARAGKAVTLHALGHVDEALDLWKPLVAGDERFFDAVWVGRELRLPTAMIDEIDRLTLRLRPLSDDDPDD